MIPITLEPLRQFRQQVYQTFYPARDAAFEILDAISDSPVARSAVEVSLAPGMQRRFSSVYKGLERVRIDTPALRQALVRLSEREECFQVAGHAVYVLDHTPYPRRSAPTVSDRGYVRGADGEVIGHQYSLLGRVLHPRGSWVGVSDCERIASSTTPVQVAAQQVARLKTLCAGPFIVTADSEYFVAELLDQAAPGCCLLARLKANRVLYDAPPPPTGKRGRPRRHGRRLQLNRPATLRPPDRFYPLEQPDGSRVELALWQNVHVRTHPDLALCAIRVEQFQPDGRRRFTRPL